MKITIEQVAQAFGVDPDDLEIVYNKGSGMEEQIVALYNDILGGYLPKCTKLTVSRKKKLQARMKDLRTVDEWRELFEAVAQSPFLMGQDGKWRASLDWLLTNDTNFVKVLEGGYNSDRKGGYF